MGTVAVAAAVDDGAWTGVAVGDGSRLGVGAGEGRTVPQPARRRVRTSKMLREGMNFFILLFLVHPLPR
jgi:hypothetical protein